MYLSCRVLFISSFASSLLCWLVCIYLFIPLKPGWTVTPAVFCISAVSLQLSRQMKPGWSVVSVTCRALHHSAVSLQLSRRMRDDLSLQLSDERWWPSFIYSCPRHKVGEWDYSLGVGVAPPTHLSSQNLSCNLTQSSPGQRFEFIQWGASASGFKQTSGSFGDKSERCGRRDELAGWLWRVRIKAPVHEIQRGI